MTVAAYDRAVAALPSWPTAPGEIRLEEHDVHIWCASLDRFREHRSQLDAALSADERLRASRFHFPEDRDRFMTSRGILRMLLGRYLQRNAESIAFSVGRFGKPIIARPEGLGLSFSASRSGGLAVYAMTCTGPLGVDVERHSEIPDLEAIAARYFALDDLRRLMAVRRDRRREECFACWTRMEALVKASGEGIGGGRGTCPSSEWQLHTVRPAAGYVAAVACRHEDARLSLWSVSKESLCTSQS